MLSTGKFRIMQSSIIFDETMRMLQTEQENISEHIFRTSMDPNLTLTPKIVRKGDANAWEKSPRC
jgi:hypothetical protein